MEEGFVPTYSSKSTEVCESEGGKTWPKSKGRNPDEMGQCLSIKLFNMHVRDNKKSSLVNCLSSKNARNKGKKERCTLAGGKGR